MKARWHHLNRPGQIQLALTIFWLAATPFIILWLRDSVPFLVFISVYAVVVGHWSAYEAATPTAEPVDELESAVNEGEP